MSLRRARKETESWRSFRLSVHLTWRPVSRPICFSAESMVKVIDTLPSPPQVLSGCAIIVRGQPRGGPPPERQINLSNIRAGAMARRAAQSQPDTKDTPDEVSGSILFVCLAKLIPFSAAGRCVC